MLPHPQPHAHADYIKLVKSVRVAPFVSRRRPAARPPRGPGPSAAPSRSLGRGAATRPGARAGRRCGCRGARRHAVTPLAPARADANHTRLSPPSPAAPLLRRALAQVLTATGAINPRTRKRFFNFSLRETLFGGNFIMHVSRKSLEYRNNLPLPIGGAGSVVLAAEWRVGQPIHKPRLMVALGGDAGAAVVRPGAIAWRKAFFPLRSVNPGGKPYVAPLRNIGFEVRSRQPARHAHDGRAPACPPWRARRSCASGRRGGRRDALRALPAAAPHARPRPTCRWRCSTTSTAPAAATASRWGAGHACRGRAASGPVPIVSAPPTLPWLPRPLRSKDGRHIASPHSLLLS
jgi:hypothetical protein